MVQQIEGVSRNLQELGFSEAADSLIKQAQTLHSKGLIPKDLTKTQLLHSSKFSYVPESRTLFFPNGERKIVKPRKIHEDLIRFLERPSETISLREIDPTSPSNARKRIRVLRRFVGDDARNPRIIASKYGQGYSLAEDNVSDSDRHMQPNAEVVLRDNFQKDSQPIDDNEDRQKFLANLTFQETKLFNALANNRGVVVEKGELLRTLSNGGRNVSGGDLRIHIYYLRRKGLEIDTVFRVGYRLK